METKHTTLTLSPEADQIGDTEGITKGEETTTLATQEKSRTRTTSGRSNYLEPAPSVEKPTNKEHTTSTETKQTTPDVAGRPELWTQPG